MSSTVPAGRTKGPVARSTTGSVVRRVSFRVTAVDDIGRHQSITGFHKGFSVIFR